MKDEEFVRNLMTLQYNILLDEEYRIDHKRVARIEEYLIGNIQNLDVDIDETEE